MLSFIGTQFTNLHIHMKEFAVPERVLFVCAPFMSLVTSNQFRHLFTAIKCVSLEGQKRPSKKVKEA